jgi:palmitoyl-protein thioesterase
LGVPLFFFFFFPSFFSFSSRNTQQLAAAAAHHNSSSSTSQQQQQQQQQAAGSRQQQHITSHTVLLLVIIKETCLLFENMMRRFFFFFLSATAAAAATATAVLAQEEQQQHDCSSGEHSLHPILCDMVSLVLQNPMDMSTKLFLWAKDHELLVEPPPPPLPLESSSSSSSSSSSMTSLMTNRRLLSNTPVVMAHGMGDSCFNDGMQDVTHRVSSLLGGVYGVCIPTGATKMEDTNNGYFLNMDASVDIFAQKVREDVKLKDGFHAMGFSQGNNVIRGYIARYNDPPVKTFISVNGVNAGEGAVPYCRPSSLESQKISMCDLLMEQASRAAYTDYAQQHSFQANYWRDPRPSEYQTYQHYSQLAKWNNEGLTKNRTLNDNWSQTNQFVWIIALQDGMVWPKEGEQWGAPDPANPFTSILAREDTKWFQQDLFGLRTAEEAGKNYYEQFDGNHLQFDWDDFDRWVLTYLTN